MKKISYTTPEVMTVDILLHTVILGSQQADTGTTWEKDDEEAF